jgi:hypothetical protein
VAEEEQTENFNSNNLCMCSASGNNAINHQVIPFLSWCSIPKKNSHAPACDYVLISFFFQVIGYDEVASRFC